MNGIFSINHHSCAAQWLRIVGVGLLLLRSRDIKSGQRAVNENGNNAKASKLRRGINKIQHNTGKPAS